MHQELLKILELLRTVEYEEIYICPYRMNIGCGSLLEYFNFELLETEYRCSFNVGIVRQKDKPIKIEGYVSIEGEYCGKYITYLRIGRNA